MRLTAVEVGEPPPFDVIIVADHSQSVSWSRDDLAAGLSTLLADVQGRDARFFVLTPTQYGASSAAAKNHTNGGLDLVLWRDAATGQAFAPAMTEYTQACRDPSGATIACPAVEASFTTEHTLDGEWHFVMPEAIAAITPAMSDAEIQAQQQLIADAILGLAAGSGSPNEQPLCTLNRYLKQNPSALPEHAVFIVISDEDDTSLPADCLASYHFELKRTESPFGQSCTQDCERYQYIVSRPGGSESLQFTCVPVDDLGVRHPERSFARTLGIGFGPDSPCMGSAPLPSGACNSRALEAAQRQCGAGHVVDPCTSTCTDSRTSDCALRVEGEAADYCSTSFTHEGVTYANLFAYCSATVGDRGWNECMRYGYRTGATNAGSTRLVPLVANYPPDVLITEFQSESRRIFGPTGSMVEVIGFDPAFECVPEQGQSHATNLKRIASSPADVFPICGDYGPALDRVRTFAGRLVRTEFALHLEADEAIATVSVLGAGGVRRRLDASRYRYDRARELLVISEGALLATDESLSVEVEKDCTGPVD